jgi:hypothetical protein
MRIQTNMTVDEAAALCAGWRLGARFRFREECEVEGVEWRGWAYETKAIRQIVQRKIGAWLR